MDYTVKYVNQYFNLNKATLKKVREYLNIQLIKKGKFLIFSQEDFDKLNLFIKENPNTRTFFQKQTFLKKYGVDNPMKLKSVKEKADNTVKEKYGVNNISQSNEIKNKKKFTSLKNHGVENPSQNKDILNKMFNTKLKKYGDKTYGSFSSEIHKKSMIKKYGVDNPMKNKEIIDKSKFVKNENKKIRLKKFENLFSVSELCQKYERCYDNMLDILKIKNINIMKISDSYYIHESELYKIEDYIKISVSKRVSNVEKELLEFIKSIYDDKIVENDRKVIFPLELDIYVPNKNVAIEFNGVYYHSNKFKDKNYHFNKTKLCEQKNIRLIHVYEDDWLYNKDIVKSMIASSLGIYERKIFARKCEIKELNFNVYKNFMDENHLQGFAKASHYIGLFYNDELVQSVGINYNGLNNIWELNRMATKLNCQVMGGFSKLVNYSIKTFDITEMNSYVFRAWFNGKGYEQVGFKFDMECPPTYWYIVNDRKVNRMNYQKNKIKRKVEIGELKYFNKNETEFENMAKNGINWIWDCGKIRLKLKI